MKNSNTSSQSTSSSSSKTMKERFTSLLYYIKKNKDKTVTKTEVVSLSNVGFEYIEERTRASGYSYTYLINVLYNSIKNEWTFSLLLDNNLIDRSDGTGIEDLIKTIGAYINVPPKGSAEYKKITESVSSIADDFREYENLWD